MLSMLAGHRRYAHIAALRFDGVLPELLGMTKVVSEDSVRRGLKKIDAAAGAAWVRRHLLIVRRAYPEPSPGFSTSTRQSSRSTDIKGRRDRVQSKEAGSSEPLLSQLCDGGDAVDTGRRCEPRRRAHIQLCGAGALGAARSTEPRVWPRLLRGDAGFGVEPIMAKAEARGLPYLFKLRLTKNVRRMIEKLAQTADWIEAGAGFEAKESAVRLTGWREQRRVIVLRRRIVGDVAMRSRDDERPTEIVVRGSGARSGDLGISGSCHDSRSGHVRFRPSLSRSRRRRERFR